MVAAKEQFVSLCRHAWSRRLARVFIAGMVCLHLAAIVSLRHRIAGGYPDFTVYYTAARILRGGLGHQLYDGRVQYQVQTESVGIIASRHGPLPYIHPPFEALIFLPLSYLPYARAFAVWDVLNLGALFGVALLLRRSVAWLRRIPAWEIVLASLGFFPVFACFMQGQDSIVLLLLLVLGCNAFRKGENLTAGCWFALGMFKFQLMLPVVLLMGVWKRKRAAMGFTVVLILLVLVSLGLVGWENLLRYPRFALQIANTPGIGGVPAAFAPNLRGLALGWPLHFSTSTATAVILISSALLVVFVVLHEPEKMGLRMSLAIIVSGLIGWQTNMHDLCLLVLPLVLIGDCYLRSLAAGAERRIGLLLPVLPLLISPLWFVLWLGWGCVNLMAIPLLLWVWTIATERPPGSTAGEPVS